jgi:hypothetical protein
MVQRRCAAIALLESSRNSSPMDYWAKVIVLLATDLSDYGDRAVSPVDGGLVLASIDPDRLLSFEVWAPGTVHGTHRSRILRGHARRHRHPPRERANRRAARNTCFVLGFPGSFLEQDRVPA